MSAPLRPTFDDGARSAALGPASTSFRLSPLALAGLVAIALTWAITSPWESIFTPMTALWAGGVTLAVAIVGVVLAYAAFRLCRRSSTAASGTFAIVAIAAAAGIGLARGPWRDQVMADLDAHWPEGARAIAQIERQLSNAPGNAHKPAPVVVVRRAE